MTDRLMGVAHTRQKQVVTKGVGLLFRRPLGAKTRTEIWAAIQENQQPE